MKITGARNEPFSAIRKRALAQAGAHFTAGTAAPADKTAFLGLAEADLTPAVQNAVKTLLTDGTPAMIMYRMMQWSRSHHLAPLVWVCNKCVCME